jgi:hypothetical protein
VIRHEGDPARCVVLLPGVRYFSQAPLLWFAREAAQAGGWTVVEVDERAPADEEPFDWMLGQAARALEAAGDAGTVVTVGKSLGSIAATIHDGPAIWLTPLLVRPEIVEALRATRAPTLLVGSPDDPTWGDGTVPVNPALDVLELPGLDHSLQVSGSPASSLDVIRTVTERVASWLAERAGSP